MAGNREQGYVHHVAVVLDESWSMNHIKHDLIKAVDRTVETLARDSKEWEHETRVTIYTFNSEGVGSPHGHPDGNVRCQHYDKDVLRLPSIADRYKPAGGTPLIDATLKAIDDLAQTPELYGDHAFLVYVLTDGDENTSKVATTAAGKARALTSRIERLPDNWTIACFVPNFQSAQRARNYGYPNVAEWDATTAHGVEEVGEVIQRTTRAWMENRAKGTRSAGRSLFVGGQVDAAQVKSRLTPLSHLAYEIVPVTATDKAWMKRKRPTKKFPEGEEIGYVVRIDDFLNKVHPPFAVGKGYYQLFSAGQRTREKVQGNKAIAVMDKKTSQVYVGPEARQIVGLPDHDVTVAPDANPDYEIFVKSTSDNRQLPVGTKLLIMK
jgi:hypothetical protein